MKNNRLLFGLITFCLFLLLTACGIEESYATEDILSKIDQANAIDVLQQNHDITSYQTVFFEKDGSETVIRSYLDKHLYVYEEDDYLLVDIDGDVTEYDTATQKHYYAMYIGDSAYEEERASFPLTWFEYDETEKVSSITKAGAYLHIATEITDRNALTDDAEYFGYNLEDIEKCTMQYEIDAANYEIIQMSSTLRFKDGTAHTITQTTRVNDCEKYHLNEAVFPDISTLESCQITVIENPGTPQEQTLTYFVPADYQCYFVLSSDYHRNVYTDIDCTTKLEHNTANPKNDTIFYIKKIN